MSGAIFIAALLWLGGSLAFAVLLPWGMFNAPDRVLGWALVLAWPPLLAWMFIELMFERRGRR